MKKLNFNKTIYILLSILALVIVVFGVISERAYRAAIIDEVRQNILEGQDVVTAPLTPGQYLDAIEGLEGKEPIPSGYLLRQWELENSSLDERKDAMVDGFDY